VSELGDLAAGIAELTAALDEYQAPYMVIGGLAVLVWGEPRATQDIDVTVAVPEERLSDFIAFIGKRLSVLPEHPLEFLHETHVLPIATPSGVRVDIIWAVLPYQQQAIQRAVVRRLGDTNLRVCAAEDLILYKLASTRPRDRDDVASVLARQHVRIDRAYLDPLVRSLSETLENPEILEAYRHLMEP
jgi:hypothetical protein